MNGEASNDSPIEFGTPWEWTPSLPLPILVVDANPDFASMVCHALEETGRFRVRLAQSGVSALEVVRTRDIRLAIVDLGLPDISGLDILRQLRATSPEMAIIALPLGDEADLTGAQAIGLHAIMPKPLYLPDLIENVRRGLGLPADARVPGIPRSPADQATETSLADAEPEGPAAPPAAEFQVTYTAVLVPRSRHHALTGAVADRLQGWARLLCTAWGWRPLQITVEPDYLTLTLGLSPAEAPARAVHRLRKFLSYQLLDAFPDLQADIPSQGFWASAYLLSAGEPPSAGRIGTFIQDTRRAQGIDA